MISPRNYGLSIAVLGIKEENRIIASHTVSDQFTDMGSDKLGLCADFQDMFESLCMRDDGDYNTTECAVYDDPFEYGMDLIPFHQQWVAQYLDPVREKYGHVLPSMLFHRVAKCIENYANNAQTLPDLLMSYAKDRTSAQALIVHAMSNYYFINESKAQNKWNKIRKENPSIDELEWINWYLEACRSDVFPFDEILD